MAHPRPITARAVAIGAVRWRARHGLSQRDLARRLGVKQPQVARLELGDVNPSMKTLMRLASRLDIEFTIDVRPAGAAARNITKRAQTDSLVSAVRTDDAQLLVSVSMSAS